MGVRVRCRFERYVAAAKTCAVGGATYRSIGACRSCERQSFRRRRQGGRLSGLLGRQSLPGNARAADAATTGGANEYDRNIQVSDLNCLNAVLAVGSWKKYLGHYAVADQVDETIYKIFTGTIRNGVFDEAMLDMAHDDAA